MAKKKTEREFIAELPNGERARTSDTRHLRYALAQGHAQTRAWADHCQEQSQRATQRAQELIRAVQEAAYRMEEVPVPDRTPDGPTHRMVLDGVEQTVPVDRKGMAPTEQGPVPGQRLLRLAVQAQARHETRAAEHFQILGLGDPGADWDPVWSVVEWFTRKDAAHRRARQLREQTPGRKVQVVAARAA